MTTLLQANNKKSRWYLTFLPNGAAEEEENDSDEHEEEDEEEISIHGDVAVYLYQVDNNTCLITMATVILTSHI